MTAKQANLLAKDHTKIDEKTLSDVLSIIEDRSLLGFVKVKVGDPGIKIMKILEQKGYSCTLSIPNSTVIISWEES